MAEYLGRTGSCTEGRFYPDSNLAAYAREHDFQTALIGAKFKGTNRLYTYWGHTGMKRGDYAKVLVPRLGSRQEETVVRIAAVVPALELKQASCRTAKHIQSVLEGSVPPSMKIPLPSDPFTQSWRNAVSFDIVPAPVTEHAKACMSEIDGVLDGCGFDFKVNTGPPALFEKDFSGLELRVAASIGEQLADSATRDAALRARGEAVHKQFEHYMAMQSMTPEQFNAMYQQDFTSVPSKEDRVTDMLEHYRKAFPAISTLAHVPRDVIESIIKEHPAVGAGRPKSFRPSYLTDLGPCGRISIKAPGTSNIHGNSCTQVIIDDLHNLETTQETIVSSKIETITYVTLPGHTSRIAAKDVSAAAYFDAIAALEAQIAKLEKISTKPRSLEEQIDDLRSQVRELAELCDLYHAKKEPILGQSEQADAKDSAGDATSYIARPGRD